MPWFRPAFSRGYFWAPHQTGRALGQVLFFWRIIGSHFKSAGAGMVWKADLNDGDRIARRSIFCLFPQHTPSNGERQNWLDAYLWAPS